MIAAPYMLPILLMTVILASRCMAEWYLITDYYMKDGHSRSFGGRCGETVQDVCMFVNSHVNSLGLVKYPADNECILTLDAGRMAGARYRVEIRYFALQARDTHGRCHDYLEVYNGPTTDSNVMVVQSCGKEALNISAAITQQYITLKFVTDETVQRSGFKFLVIRSTPSPCDVTEYLCEGENRCIDKRLKCDGTHQCLDGQDEKSCTGFQKFTGSILRHGSSGLAVFGAFCSLIFILAIVFTIVIAIGCSLKKRKQTIAPSGEATSPTQPEHARKTLLERIKMRGTVCAQCVIRTFSRLWVYVQDIFSSMRLCIVNIRARFTSRIRSA